MLLIAGLAAFGAYANEGARGGPEVVIQPAPTPLPQPWPPVLQVFSDDFESGNTYASYTALGGASVTIANGQLNISIPDGVAPGKAGMRMRFPRNGTPIRCTGFGGIKMPDVGDGELNWKLFGYDDAGNEVLLAEFVWVEEIPTGEGPAQRELRVYKKKSDGSLTGVTINGAGGKGHGDIDKIRWDTKWFSSKVQAEITFTDGTTASSDWVDPPPAGFAGFDLTASFVNNGEEAGEISVGGTGGTEVHSEEYQPYEPIRIAQFSEPRLTALFPHWLVQTRNAEDILVGTIETVGRRVEVDSPFDHRPRIAVSYFLDETLMGTAPGSRFTVYHALDKPEQADRFRPGAKLILYLLRGDSRPGASAPLWYWDIDRPTGVIPFNEQNRRAVVSRIRVILGGTQE
jgi:hypothetical protein